MLENNTHGADTWCPDTTKPKIGRTHRAAPPDETISRLRPHLGQMGIARIGHLTGLDRIGLPVVQAVRPVARSMPLSLGSARTVESAETAALMEAAENWHAENLAHFVAQGTACEMRQHGAILDPAALSDPRLPSDELERATLGWVTGSDLLAGAPVYVPYDWVSLDLSEPPDCVGLWRTANGLASGNTEAEATASALLEVIERDCLADFLCLDRTGRQARQIHPDLVEAGPAGDLLRRLRSAGTVLTVWDITNDLGVPACHALLGDPDGSNVAAGQGCHLDPAMALSRAILEAVQGRLAASAGLADTLEPRVQQPRPEPATATIFAAMGEETGPSLFSYRDQSGATADEDTRRLLDRLRQGGCDTVVRVDLTHEQIGLPVVRVIVPGLGRMLPGHAPMMGDRHDRIAFT